MERRVRAAVAAVTLRSHGRRLGTLVVEAMVVALESTLRLGRRFDKTTTWRTSHWLFGWAVTFGSTLRTQGEGLTETTRRRLFVDNQHHEVDSCVTV